ncbi:MAG: SPOR domain-containing protein [Deltaproteobacteria bacterium]|nr:SPOR domain-containing protein [Deltaproteobacteria bacterium]
MPQRDNPTANRERRSPKPPRRAGIPFTGAVLVAALAGLGAFWAGDTLGYQRGFAQAHECDAGDPLARLDQQAAAHQVRLAAAAARTQPTPARREGPTPVVTIPALPDAFSFHETLKGAPGRPQDRSPVLTSASPNPARPPTLPVVTATPTPPPAPAGLRVGPAAGEFTLQAGAFPDKNEALRLHDRLRALGYRPVIAPSETAGSTWYRVRVGRFAERASAEVGIQALGDGAGIHAIPVRH